MIYSTISILLLVLALLLQQTTSFHINVSSTGSTCTSDINNINNMSIGDSTTKDSKDDGDDDTSIITFSSILSKKDDEKEQEIETEIEQEETVLIILNYPIPELSPIFHHIWESSTIRIAADGGANRLYDYSKSMSKSKSGRSSKEEENENEKEEEDLYIPNRIRGDLDSLKPNVRSYYENHPTHNVIIEKDACQDTNDLDKALQVVCCSDDDDDDNDDDPTTTGDDGHSRHRPVDSYSRRVIIYGAFGGRFDQEMASFAALYKWSSKFNYQLYLYSDETCAFLIPANIHCHIRLPYHENNNNNNNNNNNFEEENMFGEGPTCGLIPLGCRCESIITSGLKWDLDGTIPLEFGGLVSSSNHIMEPIVKIFASHPIIFTAEICTKK